MPADLVRFGDGLEIDRIAYELRRSGRALKLERIPMEVLLLLLERKGQLVSRDEIIARIWGKDVFLDTDNSINSAIRKIRLVLRDDPETPVYIQTVTGKGYRFIGVVEEAAASVPSAGGAVAEAEMAPVDAGLDLPSTPGRSSFRWRWLVAIAGVVVLAAAGIYFWRVRGRSGSPGMPRRVMLAVLPFANLSDDPAQEYFSDGLTEETITDLGEINPEQLGVIARTSSASYKHTSKTIAEIGRELGVDYVLEGSVRREAGATRISAQLIRVGDQVHLWAHNYDRASGGLLALQSELGSAIARQVQVKLAPAAASRAADRRSPDPEAYELYLKGRYLMNKQAEPELSESTKIFQQSVDKDPSFALGYAGLASSYLSRSIGNPQEFDPNARAAASRSLELDDDVAEAHAVLGAVMANFEYDWPGASQEFRRAIELNPSYADARQRYAWSYLLPLGRFDDALAEMKGAIDLDPFSRIDNTQLGCAYLYARRYNEALGQFKKAIELNPDFFVTYYHLAWLYSQLGQYPEAITALTRGRTLAGDDRVKIAPADEIALRKAFAAEGAKGFWKEMLREGETDDREIGEFGTAQIYARLGDKESALRWLYHNYAVRLPLGTLVNVDPTFDSIRDDPRFVEIVRRMGLRAKSE